MENEYQIPQTNKSKLNLLGLLALVVLVAILVAVVYYVTKVNKPTSFESHEVSFMLEKGWRTRQITNQLYEQKVIGNPTVFLIYTTLHGAGSKIQAGVYALNSNMAIPEIIDVLTAGKVVPTDRSITIVEGWTNKQIADYLVARGIIKIPDEFLQKAKDQQGFLFPDTYKLGQAEGATELVQKMLSNFDKRVLYKVGTDQIIMASIIEKEVGRNKNVLTSDDLAAMQNERALVASVFYNRLGIGMPLESDATVNYITGKKDRQPLLIDTKVKSPYNTYQVRGLPPGPISNPGLGAIEAAITPAKSDYLYFLNKPDGEAVFAKTLAGHNANKVKYLK